jgi:hypothetical protein
LEIASHILEIAELALIVAVLFLRGRDGKKLSKVAKRQGRLVELVRSSLHPAPSRCAQCDHEHQHHFGPLGQPQPCGWRACSCREWADPGIDFADDDMTPTPEPRS